MRVVSGLVMLTMLSSFPGVGLAQLPPKPQIGRLYLPDEYWGYMVEAGKEFDVDPRLIMATAAIESRFDPEVTSGQGSCIGLMQLHKDTARSLGVDPWDPRDNIRGGTMVLAKFLHRYHGNLRRVFMKYNAKFNYGYFREIIKAYHQALATSR
jgi:soluble lytic murein transglycosylase-like protein